ncbi:glycosyltransferase family 4 protein [uncultured Bacteroides sp.]|uniref:glycosyltransferase family 4 protein n=1 Tax=uncultured Bacteroides sp. TaxID=162156 RepID=UPI00280BEE37|nr:glycosyltransferase family 4 protein [uncultured Bacteroides sp.]
MSDKIVFVLPSFKTGGGIRVFIELANILCRNNDIVILYPNNSSDSNTFCVDKRIEVLPIGKVSKFKCFKLLNLFMTIYMLNTKYKHNVILITDPLFCLFSSLLCGKKIFRFIQVDDYAIYDDGCILGKGLVLKIYKKMCLRSYCLTNMSFIFNSRYVYDRFCELSKRKDVPFNLVHPGINHSIFNHNLKNKINRYNGKINICLVARKHPWKGLLTFIDVYNSLSEEILGMINDVYLVSHDDLSTFNIANMILIKPKSDFEIADVYSKSDIFISPSWFEGFGLPPLEAMSTGCSIISSRSGGVNEFCFENHNCLMFEPKNGEDLNGKLIELVKSSELRNKLISNGICISRNFTWEKSVEQLKAILEL